MSTTTTQEILTGSKYKIPTSEYSVLDYQNSWKEPKYVPKSVVCYYKKPRTQAYNRFLSILSSDFDEFKVNCGGKIFYIPHVLKSLYEEIQTSKEILALEDDWDGNGAETIPEFIYNKSIEFLIEYTLFLYKNKGIVIDAPEINPGRNGNIHLSWRTQNARLLISFENNADEGIIGRYYGDLNDNKFPIKGQIQTASFQEHFAIWMKNLV